MKSHRVAAASGIALAILGVLMSGCGAAGAGSPPTERLVITGSSTVAPLVAEIGKRFEAVEGVRVDVQTGGSSRGIADARQGLADIGMASRALGPAEEDLSGHTIARDGICVIVHRDNPVERLDDSEVVAIFTGRHQEWSEVGGETRPITVVNKAEGRSTLELFLKHFALENRQVAASVVIGDNEQGIKTVAGNPGAVGYVSIGAAEHAAARGVAIKLLPMSGVVASTEALSAGTFPLARPLTLVTRGTPSNLAQRFIEYARSPAVSDLVRELSFVPAS
ncbi:MAG: phosphate ABC transporter substrate-binding protein [Acidobacteriota bacterium]